MTESDLDLRVRLAAFQWLRSQMEVIGEVLPRTLLEEGFAFERVRVHLVGPQGIFKPHILTDVPLSITTTPNSRYPDSWPSSGLLRYAYRGTNTRHPDNVRLRRAMQRQLPLVYFYGIWPGQYLSSFPVYVVGDRESELAFEVAVDDLGVLKRSSGSLIAEDRTEIRREYVTATVRRRLHQQAFRARVIAAYRTRCALCRLRHQELLDAAHITADSEETGEPVVSNGLSLCKLHHAAFDRHFLTVRPDYVIEVRRSILEEEDGPMLLHGLKEMHERQIIVPRDVSLQPDRERLQQRYAEFQTHAYSVVPAGRL
jgi:putative restriction endonuclease